MLHIYVLVNSLIAMFAYFSIVEGVPLATFLLWAYLLIALISSIAYTRQKERVLYVMPGFMENQWYPIIDRTYDLSMLMFFAYQGAYGALVVYAVIEAVHIFLPPHKRIPVKKK